MKILIVGAGKVGLPLASHFGDLGHEITVYDKSPEVMARLNFNPYPWEPDITKNWRVAPTLDEACKNVQVVFIVTPTEKIGNTLSSGSVREVLSALELVVDHPITVAVVSTLDPRDADAVCEDRTNLKVVYNPPLVRLGSVKNDLRGASMLLLGGDLVPVQTVLECYGGETKARPIIGNVISIACAKLAINATLSMRAAWGNDIAAAVTTLGGNVATVFEALSAEPRIGGTSYMRPGPPPSGPCLPRDLDVWSSFSFLASQIANMHRSALDEIVHKAVMWVGERVSVDYNVRLRVGIVGVAYKPGGPDATDAAGMEIVKKLRTEYFSDRIYISVYDPIYADSVGFAIETWDLAIVCHRLDGIVDKLEKAGIPTLMVAHQ